MSRYCHTSEFMELLSIQPAIDVRSPSEFHTGHIPGVKNLPILNDEQRTQVGTTYKQQGKYEAIELGFALAGPDLAEKIQQARTICPDKKLLLYCWRGGMRSSNMAWLLETNGFDCTILEGGYKAFRQYGKSLFTSARQCIVLGGYTGANKTKVLHELIKLGEQVLDIEAIARHRGSSFGMIGQEPQHPNEYFENLLIETWMKFDLKKRIWLEDESKILGSNHLPEELYQRIRKAPVLKLEVPVKQRAKNLVETYGVLDNDELEQAIRRIERKLGGKMTQEAIDALLAKDYAQVAEISLHYYDKTYEFGLSKRDPATITCFQPTDTDNLKTAKQLIYLADKMTLG